MIHGDSDLDSVTFPGLVIEMFHHMVIIRDVKLQFQIFGIPGEPDFRAEIICAVPEQMGSLRLVLNERSDLIRMAELKLGDFWEFFPGKRDLALKRDLQCFTAKFQRGDSPGRGDRREL